MNQIIKNSVGETIDYSFASSTFATSKTGWIVILGHGVTGNKNRPVVVDPANALNAAGFDTLRISFTGNGDSEGDFRSSTISKEVGDLSSVIDQLAAVYPNIAYIGHSMGNAVGVIQAAKDPRLKALISLAGMVDTKTFAEVEFAENTPDEDLMWENPDCPLSSAYYNDLTQTIQSVAPLAEAVTIPWLLVHGTADDIVLPKDTESIQAIKGDTVQVAMIEGAGHSFEEPSHTEQMVQVITAWMAKIAE